MSVQIITADCRSALAGLPDASVHCCVTSPPYFGLRDYGNAGQIGIEPTLDAYVATMVDVFRDVRRVLRDDGTLWLNLGDSYAGSWGAQGRTGSMADRSVVQARSIAAHPSRASHTGSIPVGSGLKPKDLMGVPWRVAFSLQADGWWLRQDIIWHKPNPMPESVTDRCTKAHEYVFLMSKSARYHYDADAISDTATGEAPGNTQPTKAGRAHAAGAAALRYSRNLHKIEAASTRNRRSVWTVATAPFSEAHFATFPPALVEPCILAGCPVGGTVLDPFGGAGTTALVADRLGRSAILIEINPTYAEMARDRINGDAPMFAPCAEPAMNAEANNSWEGESDAR